MKRIILSLVAIATISLSSFGQAPEGFKYQAVVRDGGNTILNNQAVGMRMTIQQGSIGGTTVYQETFATTTNAYGLVNLEIGSGTVVSGDFTTIDWSAGPYFIETAVDVTGGSSYAVMGTSQLMSVPYALHAKTAENVTNDMVDDADADPNNEIQDISLTGTDLTISSGSTVDLSVLQDGVNDADADPNNELQSLSVSVIGDTLYLSQSGWIIIPGLSNANYSVQDQLNLGITPCQLYNSGVSISELYGKTYQGGWIFYFNPATCMGLIASSSFYDCPQWASNLDQSTSVGFTDIIIGSGQANTNMILSGQTMDQEENQCFPIDPMQPWLGGTIMDLPARYCDNYVVGVYDDWYLPSKNEVLEMVTNLSLTGVYWTSSENSASEVHVVDATGLQVIHTKSWNFTVRPVRSF